MSNSGGDLVPVFSKTDPAAINDRILVIPPHGWTRTPHVVGNLAVLVYSGVAVS
jgi:hypothetical protein